MNYQNLEQLAKTLDRISLQTNETYYIDFQHTQDEVRVNKTSRFLRDELEIIKPFFDKLFQDGLITDFRKDSDAREYRVFISAK